MIIVKLMGGLGNQLFQYAAARSLSIHKKTSLYLDYSFFDHVKASKGLYRNYELNAFNVKAKRANGFQMLPFSIVQKSPSLQSILPYSYFQEPHFLYTSALADQGKNVLMNGYWQSEKYFSENEKQIRDDFQFVQSLAGSNKEYASKINNCNAVAVHIRRGDYVTNPQINATHGTCSIDYYQNAIALLKSKLQNPSFFFFSDDSDWAAQNFSSIENSFFVTNNKNENSFYDMHLMSLCNHFIIANSSFSWWGAWLGTHKEKVVIAPAKWFNTNEHNTKDLLPDSWIKL